ncbi:MAG: ArsR family transcriptional regulator [Confluentimicrobium sp.]|uniref:MarR family winged helix-turn-helix transcriptional regulator n=1 Tax=Actibacterium sp. TaxID=1872125 RepID=UPI000C4888B9|nr:MarR family transcriptional regulator [Actibacterium sp.]MBC58673.1 ArsR family transcriptional regulator [Actibacterium sp.]
MTDRPDDTPAVDDLLRLDRQGCFPLYAATNLLQRLYRPLLAPLGLTYSQYLVMLVLWGRDPVSVGDLCACLHLDNGTMSPLLKRMEQAGFIARQRDPDDERRVLITLTPHGRALREQAEEVPKELARRIEAAPDEIAHVRSVVQSLVGKLDEAV